MRTAITLHERLTATLRFLATGRSYEDLKFSTAISAQSLNKIIPETYRVIYKILQKQYLKFPRTDQDWTGIAGQFEQPWNFPHCLGAIDGKHVEIIPPMESGSLFYNYKGRLQNTLFYKKLENKSMNIPPEAQINNSQRVLPYVFVADDAFALRSDMLKPFRMKDLTTHDKKIYNYRVSRARRVVESAFGIMAARFRIFHTPINLDLTNIDSVVLACCVFHNFLIHSSPNYVGMECFGTENIADGTITPGLTSDNSRMINLAPINHGNPLTVAKTTRQKFVDYFVNEGKIPWQDNFVH